MTARRYELNNTSTNLTVLAKLIEDPRTLSVRLFASPRQSETSGDLPSGVMWTNLPLVSALVEIEIPGFGTDSLVFDGNFLTAARFERAREVTGLLDIAINAGTVVYGTETAPFTSGMTPEEAAEELARLPTTPLTAQTRSDYWFRLATMREGSF